MKGEGNLRREAVVVKGCPRARAAPGLLVRARKGGGGVA